MASATDDQTELRADPLCFQSRGGELLRLLDVVADRIRECLRVGERYGCACARGEDVLGIPVGGRDGGTACGKRKGERAGGDLLAVSVRGHEDVRRGEQVGELVDRQEAVVERNVALQAQVHHLALELQAILLALAPSHLRVGATRDHVQDLGVPLDDRRQRLQRRLEALAGR